jgi:hypothetical protein
MKAKLLGKLSEGELNNYKKSVFYRDFVLSGYQYTDSSLSYYSEYYNNEYLNFSIVVFNREDVPILGLYAFSKSEIFTHFGSPVQIIDPGILLVTEKYDAYKTLLSKLNEVIKQNNCSELIFYENDFLIAEYFKNIRQISTDYISYVNLDLTETEIKSNLRKRYKTFVNWGEKNLSIELMDCTNPDYDKFISFRNFHIETAGRQTRSDRSWDIQFEAIKNNDAYLVMGYYQEKLVSGTLNMHGIKSVYYGVGVNDRMLMEQNVPISHQVMFYAILEAKKKGMKEFIVGMVNNEEKSEKEISIFKYKAGFTNTIAAKNKFSILLKNNNDD